jgi:long-chain acyl-CoA synthetase
MKIAFLSSFVEGYGLTETCGGCTATHMKDVNFGCVGSPIACSEVKLVDVPDMVCARARR